MIDVIARGMIEESNGDISQLSEKVNNHTEDSDIHVTATDKENWNSHPTDISALGNPVQIDGLQGGVPFSEMAVSGKNLISNKYTPKSGSINSTIDENGIVTVSTTKPFSGNNTPVTANTEMLIPIGVLNRDCTIGITWIDGFWRDSDTNSTWLGVNIVFYDNNKNVISGTTQFVRILTGARGLNKIGTISNKTLEIPESAEYFSINFWISGSTYLTDFTYGLQLEYGTEATEYEPPITGRELAVGVSGKNLMKYPYYNTTQTQNGVTFTDNGDGSITVNGTATATAYFSLSSNKALPTGKYVLGKSMDNILLYVDKYLDNAFYQRLATSTETIKELIFNVSEEDAQKYTYKFGIQINKGNTEDNVTIYPQLELGDTATDYEPYHGAEYTITPTSNPYVIPNDIRQVDGRNVVSVSAGELSVTGVRKNAAIKRIWDEIDEIKTAIIVSNGETE